MPQNAPIRLIVGLGNIGPEYEGTRHNAGFMLADRIADKYRAWFSEEKKFSGSCARASVDGQDVWLLKPSTYMNRSGLAVSALAQYYRIAPEEILVLHDELDLMPGDMKIKIGGGNAGHNGLKDITAQLGTPNFWRMRLGTGHPRTLGLQQGVADFVLSRPSREQALALEACLDIGLALIPDMAAGNFARASRLLSKALSDARAKAAPAPATAR